MQSVTVPVTSVTFTWEPDPKGPTYFVVSILGMPVAGMWHAKDSTAIEILEPNNPEEALPDCLIWVHGPDEAQRTTEALTQLAAHLFPVPA